jgi:Flp pilus assembly protein TadG
MLPLKLTAPPFPSRRGIAAVYSILMLVVLCGLVSMGVDLGRVQLAKTELRGAADAAARAAAAGLISSVTQSRTDAISVAAANRCDGLPVVLDSTADIEYGTWTDATRTFTLLTGVAQNDANAVRITARRTAARGNPIPLVFARLVGRNTCDINASAIAKVEFGLGRGFTGLNFINVRNNAYFVSYNSAVNPNPTIASSSSNAIVASNGEIDFDKNSHVHGNVVLGSSGFIDGTPQITGTTQNYASPLPTPPSAAWAPGTNPLSLPQNYTVSSSTTLPGGTYWFTHMEIDHNLTFSGPATVYVNGDIDLDADLTAWNNIPANLKIYQIGSGRTFGDDDENGMKVVADVEAPGADFVARNNVEFYGVAVFRSMETNNNAHFFFDEAAGWGLSARNIALVR